MASTGYFKQYRVANNNNTSIDENVRHFVIKGKPYSTFILNGETEIRTNRDGIIEVADVRLTSIQGEEFPYMVNVYICEGEED